MIDLTTIIVSAIVSVIVAYVTARANGYSKDVIAERKEWRDRIRVLTIEAAHLMLSNDTGSPTFQNIIAEFRVRLNPDDKKDRAILETLNNAAKKNRGSLRHEFLARVARLLKHDWERAKSESRLLCFLSKPNGYHIRQLKSYERDDGQS